MIEMIALHLPHTIDTGSNDRSTNDRNANCDANDNTGDCDTASGNLHARGNINSDEAIHSNNWTRSMLLFVRSLASAAATAFVFCHANSSTCRTHAQHQAHTYIVCVQQQ